MKTTDGLGVWAARLVLATMLCVLMGCSPYHMQGIVVEGAESKILVVSKDDPRLAEGHGIPLASIKLTLEPNYLSRRTLPQVQSEVDGTFALPVDEPGAGYLDHWVRIIVQRDGYNTATSDRLLPGPSQRLLVTLVYGEDHYQPEPPDLKEETLKMGEPYMQ